MASAGFNDDQEKFLIAHELGHAVAEAANGWVDEDLSGAGGGGSHCLEADGRAILKQYASNAANEGIANYYSAVAFNNSGQSDCEMANSVAADYTQDGDVTDANETTPSCEGTGSEGWVAEDFLGNVCDSTWEDRGTAWDWTRAFWDADTDEGITTTQIFDMWTVANPDGWDKTGTETPTTASDDVEESMLAAANALLLGRSGTPSPTRTASDDRVDRRDPRL